MKFTNTALLAATWLAAAASASSLSHSKNPATSLSRRYKSPMPECKDGYCRMGCDPTADPGMGVPSEEYQDGEPWCWLVKKDVDSVNQEKNNWIGCDENGSCDSARGQCAYPDGDEGGCGVS